MEKQYNENIIREMLADGYGAEGFTENGSQFKAIYTTKKGKGETDHERLANHVLNEYRIPMAMITDWGAVADNMLSQVGIKKKDKDALIETFTERGDPTRVLTIKFTE